MGLKCCGKTKQCITCAASKATMALQHNGFRTNQSSIIKCWNYIQKDLAYQSMSDVSKIALTAAFMTDKRKERRDLAKIGAYRLSRKQAMEILKSGKEVGDYNHYIMETRNEENEIT
eukprot:11700205-Heterocapsa_arctica.AAC.1